MNNTFTVTKKYTDMLKANHSRHSKPNDNFHDKGS